MNTTVKMFINFDSVRAICIEKEWYTRGTNADYEKLYDFIESINNEARVNWRKPRKTWSKRNVLKVAEDIVNHSDPDNFLSDDYRDRLESVLWDIYNRIANYCIYVEE